MQDKNLKLLLNRLAPILNPIEVYLFGSRARGDARPDSDYDLLFVLPDDVPNESIRLQDVTALYRDTLIDADIVPCWYSTFLHQQDMIGTLSFEAKHEGKRIYARA